MFSKRAEWSAPLNELTIARRARGALLDLTETNPTRAALPYPHDELAEALARGARASYDPDPRGLSSAREALAASLQCSPGELLLTASTSEAYSFLFKLLTDPGDVILTATPSYPLLEHLAALELVELRRFPLEFHRRWELHDVPVDARTRAIVVVNPNNPTGSFVTPREQDALASHGVPVISDEVFLEYPLDARGESFVRDDVLAFTLGGLSKSAGLPHFKLGWIRVSGPGSAEALDALELIADNFLSVATPVQVALPELLRIGARIREAISERTRANLATLRAAFANVAAVNVLPVEGGWSAVIRVPRVMTDEQLALALLDRGVVVQPGYFFDFESEGYLVVSLLTEEPTFREGVARIRMCVS
ncbi:MAG TPA: pyridoxal phosphate-dependent aminotransferase [Thermoanaerobaculia bacterium]|nr:pyridoxal phosphate-dependent aminotransferase [Thermoanaerobaculia bacterium]